MNSRFTTPVARGLLFVTIAAIAWGTGGVIAAVLYLRTGLGPIAISFWRAAIGVAVLAPLYASRRPRGARSLRGPLSICSRLRGSLRSLFTLAPGPTLVTGVGLAVYQTAYYAAVARSGVAVATVLTLGSAPVLIAVGARLTISERLGPTGVVAVAAAPFGLLLVVGGTATGGSAAGVILSLLSAAGYAVVTVLHRSLGGVDPDRTTLTGFAVAAMCLLPLAIVEGLWPARGSGLETVALLGYLGVFSTAMAYRLFFASLGALRAATVSIVSLSEPLTAAALAALLLGERLTWTMVGGAVVLLGAVLLLARGDLAAAPG